MKLKLKLITAALVLASAAAGSAHATFGGVRILDGSWDGGEVFMTLWNQTNETSYIRETNMRMDALLNGALRGDSWTWNADARMTTFLGMAAPSDRLVFAVAAMDTAGATATNFMRVLTTISTSPVPTPVVNQDLWIIGASGNMFLGNVNGMIGNNDSLIVIDPSLVGYAGSATWGARWGGRANWNKLGAIGTSTDLYLVRQTTGQFAMRNQRSIYQPVSFNGLPYQATLDMSGNLKIAPVPEPETYALMLVGLGLVGWMARRRKA